jgi:alpha-galactosidase
VNDQALSIAFVGEDFSVATLDADSWIGASATVVDRYWSGEAAPGERRARVRLLWSDAALYVRFDAKQNEPLIVSEKPDLTAKTIGLWDRDVCEIFIAPDREKPWRYFEFEVAPTGEWVDLAIDLTSGERETDWDYKSGMESFALIEDGKVTMAIKIPWGAFGRKPSPGDVWLGNMFRCVGAGDTRGYLAWRPTMTDRPNFHLPEAFGEFVFLR